MELIPLLILKKPRINGAFNYLKKIPAINCGGCGWSALAIYEWLKIRGRDISQFKIVFCFNDWDSMLEYNINILSRRGIGIKTRFTFQAAAHVLFSLDNGKTWRDVKKIYQLNQYRYYHFVTVDELKKSLTKSNTWNDMFDKHYWLPKIEKKFKIQF